jgi:hypothetical protein
MHRCSMCIEERNLYMSSRICRVQDGICNSAFEDNVQLNFRLPNTAVLLLSSMKQVFRSLVGFRTAPLC